MRTPSLLLAAATLALGLCIVSAASHDSTGPTLLQPASRRAASRPNNVLPGAMLPVVVNTWPFVNATAKAWQVLDTGATAVDAVVSGCTVCEEEQCDGTVGFGGSPDSTGETTLDAMVMDGVTRDVGAVGYLRRVKNAIGVARAVMDHSAHTLLAGDGATAFAQMMGFPLADLETPHSVTLYDEWLTAECQPNYWRNVVNQSTQCPPYKPEPVKGKHEHRQASQEVSYTNHDTIGMLALDKDGNMACGTSTNGADHKIAGRVGDSPIMGAGSYVENGVGAAAATGDGDVMMRFLPTYRAVLNMKNGMSPTDACSEPIAEIAKFYPTYQGALVCMNATGGIGGAGYGWTFTYAYASPATGGKVVTVQVPPIKLD